MRLRRRLLLFALVMAVLFLAAFSMFIILVSMRPLDPEMLRAPGFSQDETGALEAGFA
ncbi:hypothetical protein [Parvibaculum sp.]|jgi:uncharacterized membrane protein (DUF485 family)|uniref:hypothetical protein n=1 Tax=Parvibaculum sp. TaxID=2024848 RepID=UPI001B0D10F6|nr:hypothetical protein [Parvibaculum sp.]MBO6635895.1 hypothetical protein [Parvibaculum sp.]MBO6679772.1 hypothetical protein [Parvibaculum sp.]MBO6683566.1 hypothetical protein [Parvibaculum sp.]MBO6904054.1 hypothetical protein [Parvibaculum sp.]